MIIGPGITFTGGIYVDANAPAAPPPSITRGSALFTRASITSLSTTVTAPGTSGSGNDVTYEWFFRTNSVTAGVQQGMLQTRTSTTGADGIDVSLSGATISITTSGTVLLTTGNLIAANTWYHCAVSRNGTQWALWINGGASGNFTFANSTGTELRLGVKTAGSASEAFDGYISNFRYIRGTALYTGRFTPPIEPLTAISGTDLLLNTVSGANFLVDSSGNNRAITNNNGVTSGAVHPFIPGSGSFNVTTTNQTYQIPTNAAFTYGTGDFTVEWFSNQTSTSGVQGIWRNSTGDATNSIGFWTITQSGGTLTVTLGNGVSSNTIQSNAAITTQTWHHYAFVRNGTLFKLYVDGVGQTQTITSSIDIPAQVGIMQIGNAGGNYGGFITNFRIVKGTAVYVNDFTPPTEQLTAISGTSLLLNFYSAGLTRDSSAFNHTITNTGATFSVGTPFITSGIIKSGLAIHLDASDVSSYPGSGTSWTSLVNGYAGSMGTGVGYSASNGGVITFNGASTSYVNLYGSASALVAATNNFSIEAWYQSNNNFPGIMRTGSGATGFVFGYFNTTGTAWKVTKYGVIDLQAGTIPQNTSWHQAVLTYSSTTGVRVYIDGALSGTAVNNNTNLRGGGEFSVGRSENVTLNGSMGIFRWYSAVLSETDVLQNYNAQRARFGL